MSDGTMQGVIAATAIVLMGITATIAICVYQLKLLYSCAEYDRRRQQLDHEFRMEELRLGVSDEEEKGDE